MHSSHSSRKTFDPKYSQISPTFIKQFCYRYRVKNNQTHQNLIAYEPVEILQQQQTSKYMQFIFLLKVFKKRINSTQSQKIKFQKKELKIKKYSLFILYISHSFLPTRKQKDSIDDLMNAIFGNKHTQLEKQFFNEIRKASSLSEHQILTHKDYLHIQNLQIREQIIRVLQKIGSIKKKKKQLIIQNIQNLNRVWDQKIDIVQKDNNKLVFVVNYGFQPKYKLKDLIIMRFTQYQLQSINKKIICKVLKQLRCFTSNIQQKFPFQGAYDILLNQIPYNSQNIICSLSIQLFVTYAFFIDPTTVNQLFEKSEKLILPPSLQSKSQQNLLGWKIILTLDQLFKKKQFFQPEEKMIQQNMQIIQIEQKIIKRHTQNNKLGLIARLLQFVKLQAGQEQTNLSMNLVQDYLQNQSIKQQQQLIYVYQFQQKICNNIFEILNNKNNFKKSLRALTYLTKYYLYYWIIILVKFNKSNYDQQEKFQFDILKYQNKCQEIYNKIINFFDRSDPQGEYIRGKQKGRPYYQRIKKRFHRSQQLEKINLNIHYNQTLNGINQLFKNMIDNQKQPFSLQEYKAKLLIQLLSRVNQQNLFKCQSIKNKIDQQQQNNLQDIIKLIQEQTVQLKKSKGNTRQQ